MLNYYILMIDVNEWIDIADERITLLGFKGEEAAGNILYHVRGWR